MNLHDRLPFVNDPTLSWSATGLLLFLITRQKGWEFTGDCLLNSKEDSPEILLNALDELVAKGYVKSKTVLDRDGNQSAEYEIFFRPQITKQPEFSHDYN